MSTPNLDTASKTELRLLCKSAGIRGYGAMDNTKMRLALKAHASKSTDDPLGIAATLRGIAAPERLTDGVPVVVPILGDRTPAVAAVATQPAPVTDDADKPRAKKSRTKKPAVAKSDKPSVKEWLAAQIEKHGEVNVDAAKKFVTDSGRSLVTLYRQCGELELTLDRKAGVWRRTKS